jgi:sugar (pentulose or hexulose) kinase
MKFLAVDLGASSGRTIVGDIEDGAISLEETHRFGNSIQEADGEMHWDLDGLLAEIKTGIAAAGDDIAGIGIDTWGVDYGYISADGTLLGQPFAYRDPRSEPAMAEVYDRVSQARLYEIAGIQEMSLNSIFQVMADKMLRPEIFDQAERLLFIPELLMYQLTGNAVSEYTICSTSGLLDATSRSWSAEVLDALGIPRRLFGEVQYPGAEAGTYNGIPVYLTACHDTGSAVAAVPAVADGEWAYISSGTWSLVGAELDDPVLSAAAQSANFTNEGGAAGKIRFLKNVNGLWLVQECQRMWQEQGRELAFAEIAAAAEASTFSSTIDPNDARFMAPANMLDAIREYCAETHQAAPQDVGDYARCCYLSLAIEYAKVLRSLETVTGRTFSRLHVVGGGCQATLLNQLTADHCGIPVHAGPVEATALGNICLQAMANGLFADLSAVRAAIAAAFPLTTYEPAR